MNNRTFSTAQWIWLPPSPLLPEKNLYARFLTRFQLPDQEAEAAPGPVELLVSVSGNYAGMVNGRLAAFGQYTDYPQRKTHSVTEITKFCVPGENHLELLVHFSGNDFSSHLDGTPGLIAAVTCAGRVLTGSGPDWLGAADCRYAAGEREKISSSLNYTFEYHADRAPGGEAPASVLPRSAWRRTQLRPTPPSVDQGFSAAQRIAAGRLERRETGLPLGKLFQSDRLDVPPSPSVNGFYERFDLGREMTGFLEFELTAPAGTLIDIAHGEYLRDGAVPAFFEAGQRHFTDRYLTRAGRQHFLHPLRRLGCRYLEFHLLGKPSEITLHTVGIRRVGQAGLETPPFRCEDPFFERAHAVSAETLRLNLHEKYENCPWREQSICLYDARNQMLFGYPFWGNYAYARAMLDLFGQSLRKDSFLAVAVPSAMKINIPSYTFLWFTALEEYTRYSGDFTLFQTYRQQIVTMLRQILTLRHANGLFLPPEQDLWNYCEAPDLEFCANPPNAFYNLYLREALLSMAALFRAVGEGGTAAAYGAVAGEIAARAETVFYDPERALYADQRTPEGNREVFHGHIQALFLEQGLVPEPRVSFLIAQILEEKIPFPALGALPYLIRGVFRYGSARERLLLHCKLKQQYGLMLSAGAQTWWEVQLGTEYAGGAGSLCHGWSAAPAFYESSCLLGIVPLTAGFRRFRLKPCSCGLRFAAGGVMTPWGRIEVRWERTDSGLALEVETPEPCVPVPESYPEDPLARVKIHVKRACPERK